jgi:hypothetical protein
VFRAAKDELSGQIKRCGLERDPQHLSVVAGG